MKTRYVNNCKHNQVHYKMYFFSCVFPDFMTSLHKILARCCQLCWFSLVTLLIDFSLLLYTQPLALK